MFVFLKLSGFLIEKYVLYWPFKTFITRYDSSSEQSRLAQTPEFAASFLRHISTLLKSVFFPGKIM